MSLTRGTVNGQTMIWNVATMAWVPWDGALTTANVSIGTVKQGQGGTANSPWQMAVHPQNWLTSGNGEGHLTVPDVVSFPIAIGGSTVFVEVSGAYSNAVLNFTVQANGNPVPILGVRTDTGVAESSSGILATSISRQWIFTVPAFGFNGTQPTFAITLASLDSGLVNIYAAETARPMTALSGIASMPTYTTALEYDGSGNPLYIGTARQGSAKSAAVWQIRKFTYSGSNPTDIQYAGGNTDYTSVWDSRASLTYS